MYQLSIGTFINRQIVNSQIANNNDELEPINIS